jgi:hypothetical protein
MAQFKSVSSPQTPLKTDPKSKNVLFITEPLTVESAPEKGKWFGLAGLLALMVVAFGLRVMGNRFGLPFLYYWDEPTIVNRSVRMGTGDLNPHFFYYPGLYIYTIFGVSGLYFVLGKLIGQFSTVQDFAFNYFSDPSGLYAAGRTMTALLGTATVGLTWWVGRRFFSPMVGWLGAIFLSVTVLHVANSHLIIADVPMAFFIVAAYIPLLNVMQKGRWRDYILFGLLVGLGIATKYLPALVLPSLLVAHYLNKEVGLKFTRKWPRWLNCWFNLKLVAAGAAVVAGFGIGSPFNLLSFKDFIEDYRAQNALSAGDGGSGSWGAFLTQWWPGDMGWPLLALALLGLGLIVWNWKRSKANVLFVVFPVLYFLFMGQYARSFARYLVPESPFMAIFAGFALVQIGRLVQQKTKLSTAVQYALLVVTVLALIAWPVSYAIRYNILLDTVDTRTQAFNWTAQNISGGTKVAIQPIFGRTFYNVPLTTDKRLQDLDKNIPQSNSFAEVRQRVKDYFNAKPIYKDIEFRYDLAALKADGVQYIFISNQCWSPFGDPADLAKENQFRNQLEKEGKVVARFFPPNHGLQDDGLFPQLPPEITIYQLQ